MNLKRFAIAIVLLLGVLVASYIAVIRPWHLRWGATDAEVTMALPGDEEAREPIATSTRAVTIHAPAATVWRWLIQTGIGRGGWYSHEWLENLFATGSQNEEEIKPELQSVKVGDQWLFSKLGNVATV